MKIFQYAFFLGMSVIGMGVQPVSLEALEVSPQKVSTHQADELLDADALTKQASQLIFHNKPSEAFPLLEKALNIRQKFLSADHPDVVASLINLGGLYRRQGNHKKAEDSLLQAIQVLRQPQQDEETLAIALHQLSSVRVDQKDYGAAESLLQEAIAMSQTTGHPILSEHYSRLAKIYQAQRRYPEAASFFVKSNETLGQHPKAEARLAANYSHLGFIYVQLQEFDSSESSYLKALKLNQKLHGKESFPVSTTALNLAVTYMERAQYEEAEPLFLQAIPIQRDYYGETHASTAMNYIVFAEVYKGLGELEKAKSLYQSALHIFRSNLGEKHFNTQKLIGLLAELPADLPEVSLHKMGL